MTSPHVSCHSTGRRIHQDSPSRTSAKQHTDPLVRLKPSKVPNHESVAAWANCHRPPTTDSPDSVSGTLGAICLEQDSPLIRGRSARELKLEQVPIKASIPATEMRR